MTCVQFGKRRLGARFHGSLILYLSLCIVPEPGFAVTSIRELELPRTLQIQSAYYEVNPNVEPAQEDGFLKFRVEAIHSDYEVEGLLPLQKLLREIGVIERIRRNEEGSGFFDGIADSVEKTGSGFVSLVSHPIESVKGVGKATGLLGRKIGGIFRKKQEGEKSTFGEKILGGSERELAKQFGVDVYTTNPYMKELLSRMAKARLGGKGTAVIANILLPVGGLVSVALTASGVNSLADQMVNDHSRADLFRMNKEALLALSFKPSEVHALLNLPYYSPREVTYMRFYLEKLKAVPGSRQILKAAVQSRSLWEARKVLYAAQIAADQIDPAAPYRGLDCFRDGLVLEVSDKIVVVTPYDYLEPSPLGERVLKQALALKSERHKGFTEIWNGGRITPAFSAAALLKGVKAKSWFLLQKGNSVPA